MTTTPDPLAAAVNFALAAYDRACDDAPLLTHMDRWRAMRAAILAALPKIDATEGMKEAALDIALHSDIYCRDDDGHAVVVVETILGHDVWNAMRDSLVRESEGAKG